MEHKGRKEKARIWMRWACRFARKEKKGEKRKKEEREKKEEKRGGRFMKTAQLEKCSHGTQSSGFRFQLHKTGHGGEHL